GAATALWATVTPVGNTTPLRTPGHQPARPMRLMRDTSIPPSGLAAGWLCGADTTTSSAARTQAVDTTVGQRAGQQPAPRMRLRLDTIIAPSGPAPGWLSGAD